MEQLPRLTISDRILARTILPLIPGSCRPNHVTVARFVGTPFVVWLLWVGNYQLGLIAFILTACTDALDGALARVRNQITPWGKVYDPLADKLLICLSITVLMFRVLDRRLAVLVILLELAIVISAVYKRIQDCEIQANRWGKIKMLLQVGGIISAVLTLLTAQPFFATLGFALLSLSLVFGLISLYTYSA